MLHELPLPPAAADDPGLAAGCALLWALGLEEQRVPSVRARPAGAKLKSITQLLFDPLMAPARTAGGGGEEEAEVWREALPRWAFAALSDMYCSEAGGGAGGAGPAPPPPPAAAAWRALEAKRLASQFAAASYGDPLFGAAVAALLRRDVALDTQLEVLQTLGEGRALALLPPLPRCPGPREAYLEAPYSRQACDSYLRLLADPGLARCVGTGSAALPVVLHRLAAAIFGGGGGGGGEAARRALLCAAVRRLGADGEGHGEAQQVLGQLLRWDCGEMGPSDAVPAERAAFLEAACAAGGGGLLAAAMAALEA
jgi:hypothetical protein